VAAGGVASNVTGHSYPAGPDAKKTAKTIYVIANTQSVELVVSGKSAGVNSQPHPPGFLSTSVWRVTAA